MEIESFEDAFARAEKAVEDLERGDLPLDECIKQYEEGFRALKRCYALLERAQKKVEILGQQMKTGGSDDPQEKGEAEPEWKPASTVQPLKEALDRIDREQISSSSDTQEHP